jgi:outer membrane murein-binding lipoprotein Lpp
MTGNSQIHFYGAIAKFDAAEDGSLMVSGIASTEAVDSDGEIVTAEAMRKAIPSYLQCGSVREMHQPIAAGRPIAAHVDDDGKTHFTAHIVDAGTIAKIKAGILKGFSIGGKSLKKAGNKITEILLKEISVVDLPCNAESVFSLIKFDKTEKQHDPDNSDCACADCKKSKTEKLMSAELIQKVDSLAETVKTLAATVKTLSEKTPAAPDLTKLETALGDLQKRADAAALAVIEGERGAIIQKMKNEARVIIGEDGLGVKEDDLKKMDLPMLKALARNAQALPTIAKATYTGTGAPPEVDEFSKVDLVTGKKVPLTGVDLLAATNARINGGATLADATAKQYGKR